MSEENNSTLQWFDTFIRFSWRAIIKPQAKWERLTPGQFRLECTRETGNFLSDYRLVLHTHCTSPVATGGFGRLSLPKQNPKAPQIETWNAISGVFVKFGILSPSQNSKKHSTENFLAMVLHWTSRVRYPVVTKKWYTFSPNHTTIITSSPLISQALILHQTILWIPLTLLVMVTQ